MALLLVIVYQELFIYIYMYINYLCLTLVVIDVEHKRMMLKNNLKKNQQNIKNYRLKIIKRTEYEQIHKSMRPLAE